jgi:SAM-dependent methyltransferase
MTLPFAQLSFPGIYERALVGPLFRPFASQLLDALAPTTGEALLDVACGTGITARLAKSRVGGGRVVGVDVNPGMLAVARSIDPSIDWREGDGDLSPGSRSFGICASPPNPMSAKSSTGATVSAKWTTRGRDGGSGIHRRAMHGHEASG